MRDGIPLDGRRTEALAEAIDESELSKEERDKLKESIPDTAFDRGIEPVFRLLNEDQVRQIVQLSSDAQLERRIEELAGKSNEGELTPEEHAEYEGYARANKVLAILQAQGRRILASR